MNDGCGPAGSVADPQLPRGLHVLTAIHALGSLWQVSHGIQEAWASAVINAGVVAYASRRDVGRAYGWS